ncbi:hypothetical protein GCM10023205_27990 [Yinghuangia aomiensis]|uniref:Uncharacterized protein n=1 Tax=Yinghuangia aomiensis TaxID=676205 RepID=A0ABP9H6Y1_9ACTN
MKPGFGGQLRDRDGEFVGDDVGHAGLKFHDSAPSAEFGRARARTGRIPPQNKKYTAYRLRYLLCGPRGDFSAWAGRLGVRPGVGGKRKPDEAAAFVMRGKQYLVASCRSAKACARLR